MNTQRREQRWEQAARDPALLKDIEDIEVAFQSADVEALEGADYPLETTDAV